VAPTGLWLNNVLEHLDHDISDYDINGEAFFTEEAIGIFLRQNSIETPGIIEYHLALEQEFSV